MDVTTLTTFPNIFSEQGARAMSLYDVVYHLRDGLGGYLGRPRLCHMEVESDKTLEEQARAEITRYETNHAPNDTWVNNLSWRIKIIEIAPCEGHDEDS